MDCAFSSIDDHQFRAARVLISAERGSPMRHILGSFYRDERGSVLLTEWLLLTTILMIGILPPLVALRSGSTGPATIPMAKRAVSHPLLGR